MQSSKVHPTVQALKHAKCESCPLNKKRNPILGHGNAEADLVIVGDNPNYADVRAKRPLAGNAGTIFDKVLEQEGVTRNDVWTTNAVLCQSQDQSFSDVPPPSLAVACCRPRLIEELKLVQPNMVLTLGAHAARSVLQNRETLSEVQGVVEYRADIPAPILPTYHPAIATARKAESQFEDLLSATRRAVRLANGTLTLPDRNEKIPVAHVTDAKKATGILRDLLEGKAGYELALDVETSELSTYDGYLTQVAIGNRSKAAVFEADILQTPVNRQLFQWLLEREDIKFIIHNMSFDRQWLWRYFDTVPAWDVDTMCLALGITEHKNKVGLKTLSREWCNAPYYEDEVHQYLGPKKSGWGDVPRHILAKYAGLDVVYTARVEPILTQLCEEEGTLGLVRTVLEPAQRTFAQVERDGILVDKTYIATLEATWLPILEERRKALEDYAASVGWKNVVSAGKERVYDEVTTTKRKRIDGKLVPTLVTERKFRGWKETFKEAPFNPASDGQVKDLAFNHLKLKQVFDDKTGNLTTGKAFRKEHENHPLSKLLEDYALVNHMMNTYVRGIVDDIKSDGRVHPNIDIRGAVTGRLAMYNPPLQTIPRSSTVKGFDSIKRMFIPSDGYLWLSSDYSQLEIRCAWYLSGDDVLGEAVMSGDFHKAMAAKMFKKDIAEVTEDERQAAKTINFGILYGMSANGLADRLNITVESAQVFIDDYFKGAPKFREWYFAQHKKALTEGRSMTPFGRVRRWNLITRENRQNVLNQSVNSPVQSFASDLNLTSFMEIDRELRARNLGRGLFLVHDSIEAEIREGREDEAAALVRTIMTTWPFDNPAGAVLDIDLKIGPNWADVKPWPYVQQEAA